MEDFKEINDEIDIDQFLFELTEDLNNFREEWKNSRIHYPENYPPTLEKQDWFQQLLAWFDTEE